jgi:hypothetical protein
MLEKGEWEPPMLQPIKDVLRLCIIRVECAGCRHTTDLHPYTLERLAPGALFSDLLRKLRCNHCDQRGRVKLYVRREPRN